MYRKTFNGMDCSIARALDQVGEWWSLLIVRECTLGTSRFDEFQRRLGIARNVLTNRLNHLCEQGILRRVPIGDSDRFFQYQLTPKGDALYPVLVGLMQWGDRWAGPEEGGPIKLVDDSTGRPVEWMGPRAKDGAVLDYRQVRLKPGARAAEETRHMIVNRNRVILASATADDAAATPVQAQKAKTPKTPARPGAKARPSRAS